MHFRTFALPLLAAAFSTLALNPVRAQAPLLQPGAVAPDFVSQDLAGNEVRLSDHRGKVVVIDFWATWCGPCLQALPHVQQVAAAHKGNGVVVLAVCTSDTRKRFEAWIKDNAAKYPDVVFACDPHDRGSDTFDERASSKLYHVSGLPTKFVVGKDGKVAMAIVGSEEGDVRLEAGLARAGLPIDADVSKRGEAQAEKADKEDAARAAEAAATVRPSFVPRLMGHKCGDVMPDFPLLGADGAEFPLSSLRGKPLVVAAASVETTPASQLQQIAQRYGRYGVRVLAMGIHTSRDDYTAWVEKNRGKYAFVTGGDPAGTYEPADGVRDPEAQLAHHDRSLLGRMFGRGMYPAMPFLFVLDADGKVVGTFFLGEAMDEGLGNLLLKAGVKLDAQDMPKKVAPPEAFVVAAPPPPEAPVTMLEVGAAAPDFASQDLAGETIKLSDYAGKVLVLDFWATWCGPCKASLPHTQEVAAKYKDQGVVVLANCTSDTRQAFTAWLQQHQGDYPDIVFTHDPAEKGVERASRKLYGVSGIPQQFVVKDGKVVAQVSGYTAGEVLLEGALAKAGVKVDAAILEQAAKDQARRDERQKKPASMPAMKLR